jgi:hypothetical protein
MKMIVTWIYKLEVSSEVINFNRGEENIQMRFKFQIPLGSIYCYVRNKFLSFCMV